MKYMCFLLGFVCNGAVLSSIPLSAYIETPFVEVDEGVQAVSGYDVPVTNNFANIYLKAYETKQISQLFTPDFFQSLFSHLLNMNLNSVISVNEEIGLNFQYINKMDEKKEIFFPYNADIQAASTSQSFFHALLYAHNAKFQLVIKDMDLLATFGMYMDNVKTHTNELLKNSDIEIYIANRNNMPEENIALSKALMNKVLDVKEQDILNDNKLYDLKTGSEAEYIYQQIKLGNVPENLLGIVRQNFDEINLDFDTRKMLNYLHQLFGLIDAKHTIESMQNFWLLLLKNGVKNYSVLSDIITNNANLKNLVDGVINANDYMSVLGSYSSTVPTLPAAFFTTTNKNQKLQILLETYDLPASAELASALMDFLEKTIKVDNINFGLVGFYQGENIAPHMQFNDVYNFVLPLDPALELEYTGLGSHVDLGQKATLLSLLGVFNASQQKFLQTKFNVKNYDYLNKIQSDNQIYMELQQKTVENFINDLCTNAKQTQINGKTVWNLWKEGLNEKYYEMEEKWNHESIPVMRIFFETEKYDKVF